MPNEPRRPVRILVVDDEPDIRTSLADLLELEGYVVSTAENGQKALEHLEAYGTPDLVLLDMRMPVMTGWEFVEALASRGLARPKILVMTAAADTEKRARDVGANGWVAKPFDVDDLLLQINALT